MIEPRDYQAIKNHLLNAAMLVASTGKEQEAFRQILWDGEKKGYYPEDTLLALTQAITKELEKQRSESQL